MKILKCLFFIVYFPFVFSCNSTIKKKAKPNVLFIIIDDLNDAVEGMKGHPQTYTPNIKKLAQGGIQFLNAQCNAPLCSPSRASLFTGIYPHKSGILGYDQNNYTMVDSPILKDAKTIFEHFADNGYQIYATGKIFHNSKHTSALMERLGGSEAYGIPMSYGPYPWDGTAKSQYISRHPDMIKPWGANAFEVFVPLNNVPEILPNSKMGIKGYTGWRDSGKPFKFKSSENRDLMVDEKSREWSIKELNQEHKEPFMLTVGLIRPHSPWVAPAEFFDLHPLEDIELPAYLENDLEDCSPTAPGPTNPGKEGKNSLIQRTKFQRLMKAYPDQKGWKRWVQAYLACISFADYQIGKILEALENSNYAENTIVVLISDNGYHMGEKNQLHKNTEWEESARIPLIIKIPNQKNIGTTVNHPVSLIDLYPTLIDLCGLPADPNSNGNKQPLDGFSLMPFFNNPTTNEWEGPEVALSVVAGSSKVNIGDIPPVDEQNYSVRSERYRYILWENGFEELYDHKVDPNEWTNLAPQPSYKEILISLKKQMNGILKRGREMR